MPDKLRTYRQKVVARYGKPRDSRSKTAARGYGGRHQQARKVFLGEHPLCVLCQRRGRIVTATVLDHIVPHKGDVALRDDPDNWQALCKPCHDRKTAVEDGGFGRERKT